MDELTVAAEAVTRATEMLAGHAGRRHRGCESCIEVAAVLLEAREAIEDARDAGPDLRLIGAMMPRN